MQIKRRIFKCLLCKLVVYSLQHSKIFDVLHVFLPLTITELSSLKQVRFFWPTLYCKPGVCRMRPAKASFAARNTLSEIPKIWDKNESFIHFTAFFQ